jgi:hypothetical protein
MRKLGWELVATGTIVVCYLLANGAILLTRPAILRSTVTEIDSTLARDRSRLDHNLVQWRAQMLEDGRWVATLVGLTMDAQGRTHDTARLHELTIARFPTARVWIFDRRGVVQAQLEPEMPNERHAWLARASLSRDTALMAASEVRGNDLRIAVASPLRAPYGRGLTVVLDLSAATRLAQRLPNLAWAGHAGRTALTFPMARGYVGATWKGDRSDPQIGWPKSGWSLADSSLIVVSGALPDTAPRFELGIARAAARARAESRTAWLYAAAAIVALVLTLGVLLAGRIARGRHLRTAERALAESRLRAAEAETAATRAGLAAVQARLNPHFLSNALHSVAALIPRDPESAEEALDRLGDLFRYSLEQSEKRAVVLENEWRFVQDYLAIEQLRFGSRLAVEMALDPAATACAVPSFVLQPLVENAIRHGVGPRRLGGTLHVSARRTGPRLELYVTDDGVGAEPSAVLASSGTGIRTLRQRLALDPTFAGHVDIDTAPNAGFRVRVTIEVPNDAELD